MLSILSIGVVAGADAGGTFWFEDPRPDDSTTLVTILLESGARVLCSAVCRVNKYAAVSTSPIALTYIEMSFILRPRCLHLCNDRCMASLPLPLSSTRRNTGMQCCTPPPE